MEPEDWRNLVKTITFVLALGLVLLLSIWAGGHMGDALYHDDGVLINWEDTDYGQGRGIRE